MKRKRGYKKGKEGYGWMRDRERERKKEGNEWEAGRHGGREE